MRSQSVIDRIAEVSRAVVFDEAAHSYTVNGKPVPSVTTVMPSKGFFVTEERLEECRADGKFNHKRLEAYFLDDAPIEDPVNAAITEFIDKHPEFGSYVGSEVVLWSKFGYAGTSDLLFENAVVDMKRTIGDKKIHALQLAGYHRAAVEHGLIASNRNHYIIRIDDKGKLEQKNVWNQYSDIMFLSCVKLFSETEEAKREIINQSIQKYLRSA